MSVQRVVLRADGNAQIGLGHLARLLALAEMLSPEFDCVFASVNPPENALSLIGNAFPIVLLLSQDQDEELSELLTQVLKPTDIVVLDGYNFGLNYQQRIKALGCRLVCIDDLNAGPFVADAIVNHAPGVEKQAYQAKPYTQLCFGFKFALLRKPFLDAARALRGRQEPNSREKAHVLITFGGADKHNLCLKLVRMCLAQPWVEKVRVVLGSGSVIPEPELQAAEGRLEVRKNLTAEEMCALMLESSFLLAPASTVVMEGLATGVPVLCGYYVPAQVVPYQKLSAAGCITPVGDWNLITPNELDLAFANRPKTAPAHIDGRQPDRFRTLFRTLSQKTAQP